MANTPNTIKGTYGTMYYVRDMKKSIAFYRDTIGLKPRFEDEHWTEFELAGHALCLHPIGEKKVVPGNTMLIIEVGDIHAEIARLKESRVEFSKGIDDLGEHGLCTEFRDLDGNMISLYQRPTRH